MRFYAALLLLGALILCVPSWAQTKTICIPVDRAARQADSLRALPIVRKTVLSQVQVIRAQHAKLDLLAEQNAAWAADHGRLRNENESLGSLLSAQTQAVVLWRGKAKRRGWVIGVGIGLPAAYGLYRILR